MSPKTIFITGAGSSVPFGFPTGFQLKEESIKLCESKLAGSEEMPLNKLREWLKDFVSELKTTNFDSIDAFAYDKNDVEYSDFCKFLIGYILAEKTKGFVSSINNGVSDWLRTLISRLTEFSDDNPPNPGSLYFLNFNYDCVLETVFSKIANDYAVSKPNWSAFFRKITIEHVYGRLKDIIPDIGTAGYSAYSQYAGDIKLMRNEILDYAKYRLLFEDAINIYFLGFGFAELNLKTLGIYRTQPNTFNPTGDYRQHKIVYASFFNPDDFEIVKIEYNIGMVKSAVNRAKDCDTLIKRYFNKGQLDNF